MTDEERGESLLSLLGLLFKSHPWHGVSIGARAPEIVTAYIEIVPTDTVKYEIDKTTGHLKIDRPQRFSNITPCLYGFIPQTFCGERVGEFCAEKTDREFITGDQDPIDICVLSEKAISHGDILLQAIPIGGLRMIDGQEADDKIIAVLEGDATYGRWRDIDECPASVIDRLKHYFLTYKNPPDSIEKPCEITHVYGAEEARECIRRSREDYAARFGDIEGRLLSALSLKES
jgi:inorganic pyrophosphatase